MKDLSSVKDSDIEEAAAVADLDEAARHIQELAGITAGDIAGICLNQEAWHRADRSDRIRQLREWLKTEALYED